jgi:hypothetical protein
MTDQVHLKEASPRVEDLHHWLTRRLQDVDGIVPGVYYGTEGAQGDEIGTRKVTFSAGTLYEGLHAYTFPAFNTDTGSEFDAYYQDGLGDFTKVPAQTQWPNEQYDDGTGALANMTAGYYACLWFFIETDGHVAMMYGQDEYATEAEAGAEEPPDDVPSRFDEHAILASRFIFLKSAAAAASKKSYIPTATTGFGSITDHGTLLGLTGDDHPKYLLHDGSRALTADWDAGSFDITAEQLYFDSELGGEGMVGYSAFFGNKINAANTAVFCHQAQKASTTKYAFSQNSSGVTNFNGAEPVNFRVNDNVKIRLYANYTDFQGGDIQNVDDITGNGGSIISGGSGASDNLELSSTTHATLGVINFRSDLKTDRWASHDSNTLIGVGVVGAGNLSGLYNTILGNTSGYSLTTGARNVFIGFEAGYYNEAGADNVTVGYRAGKGTSGQNYSNCVFAGTQAGLVNYGDDNFGLGKYAVWANTTGTKNIGIGSDALTYNQTGTRNVCIGEGAGKGASAQSFSNDTFIGVRAGYNCTTGGQNVSLGTYAGMFDTTSQQNVKVGYAAGYGASGQVNNNNTFVGRHAGFAVTTGSNNTTLGHSAGEDITTGGGNVCIGYMAGEGNLTTDSNELWISNSDTATPLIYGEFGNNFIRVNNTVEAPYVRGGTGAGNDLYLRSTSHATSGTVYIADGGGDVKVGGNVQFLVEDSAAIYTLVVDSNSRVGVGLVNPLVDLHVYGSAAGVYIRAQNAQANSIAGLSLQNDAQSWLAYVNASDNFIVGDSTGSTLPFTIVNTAVTDSIYVSTGGRVGINGAPATSAALEVDSTTGALLLPRMTTAQRNALTAVAGMLIYNSTTGVLEAYEGAAWVNI